MSAQAPVRQLGCGSYRVILQTQGGNENVAEVPWQQLNFGRKLNAASNCTISLPISGSRRDECCMIMRELKPYAHELAIYRDGYLVWVGPVTDPDISKGSVSIHAQDISHWFDRRWLPKDRYMSADLADIFETYVNDVLEVNNRPGIVIRPKSTGVIAVRSVRALDYIRAADALSELSNTGLDYTAIGRDIYIGGLEIHFDEVLRVWQPSVRIAHIQEKGTEMATEWAVIGSPPGADRSPLGATYGGEHSEYGLIQMRASEPTIKDLSSMEQAARSRHAMFSEPPRYINISFAPESPFLFNDLIPGRKCDTRIEVECEQYIGMTRLQSVAANVVATKEGGVSESIDCTLIPVGLEEDAT